MAAAAATVKFSAPAPASYCCHFWLISYVTSGLKEAFVSSCLARRPPEKKMAEKMDRDLLSKLGLLAKKNTGQCQKIEGKGIFCSSNLAFLHCLCQEF